MRISRRWLALLSAGALSAGALTGCGGSARHLVWSDEFNGPAGALPDSANWVFETFGNGSGNDELECYTNAPGNASTNGAGDLVITSLYQPGHVCSDGYHNDYTSARITTQGLHSWTYGTFEMRAKVPSAPGTWPAFWALGADHAQVGWPASGELDAMEVVGQNIDDVSGTIHGPTANDSHWYLSNHYDAGADLSQDFHTYAMTWGSDGVSWAIDGHTYASVSKEQAEAQGQWVFDKPFYLLLNLAIGGTLGGATTAATQAPQQYVIDYVRVFQ